MPQGRHKVPFSSKQKKRQLKEKRDQKRSQQQEGVQQSLSEDEDIEDKDIIVKSISGDDKRKELNVKQINSQQQLNRGRDVNRYALQFFVETEEELRERRENSRKPFDFLPPNALEISIEQVFNTSDGNSSLDLPKRPKWDFNMSSTQLENKEQQYFRQYLDLIIKSNERLSYFELNLETWRQLWRVLEMSDIILLIADIRHPVFHFPPSLYNYVINELKKDMILVLNKIDLVEASLVVAWTQYLKQRFPELHVISFASYAGMKVTKHKKRIGKLRMAANGAKSLQTICQQIVGEKVDLSSWKSKIEHELREEELALTSDDYSDDEDNDFKALKTAEQKIESLDLNYYHQTERFKDGIVTIGCVGHPNVGKSSLLNAIMGKKVVSVSRTPGHTKHFQTIFLTPTVKLCDCPGLVFPSRAPKELQVLMGCFPIAQLREPYSSVGYMAQRIGVHKILRLVHPNQEGNTVVQHEWSAYDICEAWAIKRGFFTAKAARPDTYRAANNLLRMALDGRTLCLAFYPPNYVRDRDKVWLRHSDVKYIELIQGQKLESDLDEELKADCAIGGKDNEPDEESEEEESEEEVGLFATSSKFAVLKNFE
jgi:ribosome biogenesis GTPase A